MKRFLVFVACCMFFAVLKVHAQTVFRPFRVDVSISADYALVLVSPKISIEPKYTVVQFTVPLLYASAQCDVGIKSDVLTFFEKKQKKVDGNKFVNSYLATADFSLQSGYRPFVGVGVGIYRIKIATSTNQSPNPVVDYGVVKSNLGVMLRAGFVYRDRFTAWAGYEFAGKDEFGSDTRFLSVNLGFFIGGGEINPGYSP